MTFSGNMSSDATQSIGVYDVLAWLETNKKPLIIGFVTAVVVSFGIVTYRYSANQKEVAASDALLRLRTSISASEGAPQAASGDFLKIAEEHAGTAAAARAFLLVGPNLFAEGKYAEAHAQFVRFLHEHAQSPFASTAAYGAAAALEAQGKTDEALTAYQNLPVRYPNSPLLDDAKLAVGRIQESKNQPELALRSYEELVKTAAMSTAGTEAKARQDALLARHPELVKTNAPVSTPMVSMSAPTNTPTAGTTNAASAKP